MLGVGLHACGFMDKAFTWLMIFIASQAVLILLAMLPDRFWLSFRDRATATRPPKTRPSSGRDPGLPAPAHA
jgi:hypothetical protein